MQCKFSLVIYVYFINIMKSSNNTWKDNIRSLEYINNTDNVPSYSSTTNIIQPHYENVTEYYKYTSLNTPLNIQSENIYDNTNTNLYLNYSGRESKINCEITKFIRSIVVDADKITSEFKMYKHFHISLLNNLQLNLCFDEFIKKYIDIFGINYKVTYIKFLDDVITHMWNSICLFINSRSKDERDNFILNKILSQIFNECQDDVKLWYFNSKNVF